MESIDWNMPMTTVPLARRRLPVEVRTSAPHFAEKPYLPGPALDECIVALETPKSHQA